jgi:hypothetical protein
VEIRLSIEKPQYHIDTVAIFIRYELILLTLNRDSKLFGKKKHKELLNECMTT